MPFPQPLIDLGIYYATSRAPQSVSDDIVQKLSVIFTELIGSSTTIEQASTAVAQLSCDPKSVTRIAKILSTQPAPAQPEPSVAKEARNASSMSAQHRQRSSPWSAEEDDRLLAGIYHYGLSDWQRVSQFVGNGRTRAQCGQRWLRCLDPNMKKDKWSPDEDQKLLQLVEVHGPHAWAKIAKELGNRTDVMCRYRYTHHLSDVNRLKAAQVTGMQVRPGMMPFGRAWPPGQVLPAPGEDLKFDEIKTEDSVDVAVEPKPEDVVKQEDATN